VNGEAALRRAFVALVPPVAALDHVDAAVAALRGELPSLRWAPRAHWHVTLQFLGRVDDADALVRVLDDAVRVVEPFAVSLGGGGAFASARVATVLWVGVTEGADAMGALAAAVTGATASLGFASEARPFRAHLTVARSARPTDLRVAVASLDTVGAGPAWTASEVVLFESDTRRDGAVHTAVARLALGSDGSGA
jgi:2'-5' RNA ligase